MGGPLLGMLGTFMGSMLATQAGSGIGTLASEVLSVSDVGLPLAPAGRAALLPANIEAFAEGLDVGYDDVLLYLALREAAHQRLYGSVPWLRDHVLGAVKDYGRGIDINTEAIQERLEEQMRGVDPSNPESVQQLLEGGLFDLPKSPLQVAALVRLEIVLALVEVVEADVAGQVRDAHREERRSHEGAERLLEADAVLHRPVHVEAGARWPRRGDLRGPGGPRAATAAAARRLHPVGLTAHPPGP